jgi:very-short-patch-repair endonuclease
MRNTHPYVRSRRDLKTRAYVLRREPTAAERKLWYEVLRKHAYKFVRQKPLGTYIADFYCPQKQLVIELDGVTAPLRTEVLGFQRVRVLRFASAQVMQDLDSVRTRIEEALAEASQP